MGEFENVELGSIASIQTGPFGSQLHMSDYKLEGTPIITVEHLGENRIVHENLPLVGEADKNRLKKYTLQKGDIVFSRVGSVDRRAFVGDAEDGWMFSGRCLRVRADRSAVDPKYLSYYFGQESFKEYIRGIAVGATMPSINTGILSGIQISCPKLKSQKAIAEVLSSLDDKIDLLHRQNKTLESLAQTLFRQWFIEEADGQVGKLGDLVELHYGKGLREEIRTGQGFPVIGSSGTVGYHSEYLVEGPGIVIGRKGTLGKVVYVYDNFFPIDTTYFVKPKDGTERMFCEYFLLQTLNFEEMNSDSAVPGLNRDIALATEVRIPSHDRRKDFNNQCDQLFQKKRRNTEQIQSLEKLRDSLLPKLMSGEIQLDI